MQPLDTLDWISISLYFLVLIGIAIWVIRKKEENTEDYFLAGRNIGWFVVGASIFASNIGSEHVVGLAGTGASNKLPLLIYEIQAWVVLILGWVFLPFYARSGVFTMPEFLEKRFDARSRWVLSIFSIIAYVLTKISVTIYAGGVVVAALLGIDFWTGAIATVILTGIYTVLGGMRAVVYTETLQAVLLILGAAVLTYIGLDKVGGWSSMQETLGPEYFNMWRPATDPDFPWPSLLITSTIVGIWYWCTDQYIVQRTLTARNIKEGRRGTIFGALLKLLPVFLFLIPGIIALTLKMRGELHWDSPDEAFPVLMSNLLPSGLRGLVAAGLLAALMSSLASVFNSCSTLFTVDIYKKLKPNTPEKKLVRTGQIATVFVVIVGIIWIPIMANISGVLYEYLQSVQAYIAPPITAVFILGIFYKRINATGAFATLIMGIVVAFFRIALELIKENLDPDSFLFYLGDMNFLSFGAWFFLFCLIFLVVVSLLTKAPDREQIVNLTFGTITEEEKNNNKSSYSWVDIAISILIILIVIAVMIFFNGK
ncbi:sodium:solute symporter [Arenibacter sp. M-2]|uniref:sodium:solute symporter n=1 Tax=unclassified Arenibacter TaxID=2615047 RepID=UPI000D752692|nr:MULTISPECIES: sodium:solute symporter [unclassified Arenibacter]MDL5514329.1 sodium:solute symporter [Arenibacter sp. M-2]PXX25464.1 SSS family solute:Na+ symporter [Arenibacter sp. ARW7G5Y1]|tara:strand:- start:34012 stop:35631 length:1620 start_codon:yes stop_codon:yes gene_type:complete